MVVICVRRHSDSQFSRAIQEAIKSICCQKQCPNEDRIVRFVQREFDWKNAEILRELKLAVKDGLIRETIAVSHKGSTKGSEQTSYRNPPIISSDNSQAKPVQTHDWYCFDCQESGEVALCDHCPKVFHKKCAKANYISQDEKWKCPSCKASEVINSMSGYSKEQVNKMLKFTIDRLKDKFNDLKEPVSLQEYPDYYSYIFNPMNLNCLEANITQGKFTSPEQFLEDAKWVLHNAIVYFGDDDELTVQAEELVDDAKQEVEEMLMCPDCYMLSNSKPENWFCKPCDPPHEVVWAKMTGQPPWPAKVLKWNEDKTKALVRFFEARHQRAWVYFRHISPITSRPEVKKRPRQWLDSLEELNLYQQHLKKLTLDVKPKSEPKENFVSGMDVATTSLVKSENLLSTVSCQTEEDPNKAVIDKLRKRIDDLEQDLRETKEKLNLQQNVTNAPFLQQESGKILSFDPKNKVHKIIASLNEHWQKNIDKTGLAEEDMKKKLEKEQAEFRCKLEEVKKKAEEEKEIEIGKLKDLMKEKHDCEMIKFREAAKLEREKELQELKKKLEEQRTREQEEARSSFQRRYVEELKRIQNLSKAEHERLMEEMKVKWEERRRRDVEEAKSGVQRRYESELQRMRETSKADCEKVVAELKREHEVVLNETVRETKRKQWCCNCNLEASYPCCWNTSYCSRHCQVMHWQQHRLHCNRNFVYLNTHSR